MIKTNKFIFKNFGKKTWTINKFFKQNKIFNFKNKKNIKIFSIFKKEKKSIFEIFNYFQENFKIKFKPKAIINWQNQLLQKTSTKLIKFKKLFVSKKKKQIGCNTELLNTRIADSSKKFKKTFYKRNIFCYNAYKKKYGYGKGNFVWVLEKQLINENILKTFVNNEVEKEILITIPEASNRCKLPISCKDMNLKKKYFNKIFRIKSKNKYINQKNYYDRSGSPIPGMFFASTNSKKRIPVIYPNPDEMAISLKKSMYMMDNRSFRFRKKNYRCNKKTGLWGGNSTFYWMFYKTDITKKESNKKKYSRYDRWWKNKWFKKKDYIKKRERILKRIKESKKKRMSIFGFGEVEDFNSLKNQITRVKRIHRPIKELPIVTNAWKSTDWYHYINKLKGRAKRRKITDRSWIQFTKVHIYVYKDALINLAKGIISYTKTIKAFTQSRPSIKTKLKKKKFTAVVNRQVKRVAFNQLIFKKFNIYKI